jgi:hypothetical protein
VFVGLGDAERFRQLSLIGGLGRLVWAIISKSSPGVLGGAQLFYGEYVTASCFHRVLSRGD